MRAGLFVCILISNIILIGCASSGTTNDAQLVKINKQNFIYQGEKVTIGEIEGYPEAVILLKDSIINSLIGIYSTDPKNAAYIITGSIYGKKHWRKRFYIYHTINLRVVDASGNIVLTIANERPILQPELNEFSKQLARSIK